MTRPSGGRAAALLLVILVGAAATGCDQAAPAHKVAIDCSSAPPNSSPSAPSAAATPAALPTAATPAALPTAATPAALPTAATPAALPTAASPAGLPADASPAGLPAAVSAAPPGVTVTAALLNGRADPAPHRVPIALNSLVELRVSTDQQATEVHVHGYDFAYDAEPGRPGCISFVADRAGLFDVEAHPDTLLVQLEVR